MVRVILSQPIRRSSLTAELASVWIGKIATEALTVDSVPPLPNKVTRFDSLAQAGLIYTQFAGRTHPRSARAIAIRTARCS